VRKDDGGFKLPVQIHDVRWFALPWWHAVIARCEGGIAMEAGTTAAGCVECDAVVREWQRLPWLGCEEEELAVCCRDGGRRGGGYCRAWFFSGNERWWLVSASQARWSA